MLPRRSRTQVVFQKKVQPAGWLQGDDDGNGEMKKRMERWIEDPGSRIQDHGS